MTQFHSPWFFILLPAIAAVAILALRRRPPALRVSEIASFREAIPRARWWAPERIPLWLAVLGLALLTVALARPRKGVEQLMERTHGIDIMLVLDVSGSMRAYDIPPNIQSDQKAVREINAGRIRNRIETAKAELRKFVRRRPNDRIGMIAFARLPYTVCPPTLDHDYLLNHLEMLDAGTLPDGTGIAPAIASATTRLKDSPAKRRVMVLFTDGENNVESEITPIQAAEIAHEFKIIIYTVGVGSDRPLMPVRGFFGPTLQPVQAGLDENLLRKIADITGGRYLRARDARGFARAMHEIDSLEKTELKAPHYLDYRERFLPWLIAGAACLALAFLLERTVFLRVP